MRRNESLDSTRLRDFRKCITPANWATGIRTCLARNWDGSCCTRRRKRWLHGWIAQH
jgi:hypothetical protein